jgi:hypothetical protein
VDNIARCVLEPWMCIIDSRPPFSRGRVYNVHRTLLWTFIRRCLLTFTLDVVEMPYYVHAETFSTNEWGTFMQRCCERLLNGDKICLFIVSWERDINVILWRTRPELSGNVVETFCVSWGRVSTQISNHVLLSVRSPNKFTITSEISRHVNKIRYSTGPRSICLIWYSTQRHTQICNPCHQWGSLISTYRRCDNSHVCTTINASFSV